jgi:epoxyqueuosine reductase
MTAIGTEGIGEFLAAAGVDQWGVARNRVMADPGVAADSGSTPALKAEARPPDGRWPLSPDLPFAISIGMRLDPGIIAEVVNGPTPAYFGEYKRLNRTLAATAEALSLFLSRNGAVAEACKPTAHDVTGVSDWTDAGVFPHKTAATQAGLGWIGKTALFVSPVLGPRVRLTTVFTDLELPVGEPVTRGQCAGCRQCVDACPAGAGRDVQWRAGMPRAELYDARACERQCDANEGENGGLCGICIAVCPFGRRTGD